jgi:pilus assembly protein CpaE
MDRRAVREDVLHRDFTAGGVHVADFRHPEAVERLLARLDRGDELPLVSCCAEDLEAVRRRVTSTQTPGRTTEVRAVPETTQVLHREPRRTPSRQRRSAPASVEQEHASRTFLGILPIVIMTVAFVWQLGLWGVTAAYTSYAADEAARSAGVGGATADVRDDALQSIPSWFRSNIDVSQTALGTVKVTSSMPVLTPTFSVDGLDLTSEAPIVAEE